MLTTNAEEATDRASVTPSSELAVTSEAAGRGITSGAARSRLPRALRVEWLGQTVASVCWIASVLTYGISASGDWLQLFAASSWLLANLAAVMPVKAD